MVPVRIQHLSSFSPFSWRSIVLFVYDNYELIFLVAGGGRKESRLFPNKQLKSLKRECVIVQYLFDNYIFISCCWLCTKGSLLHPTPWRRICLSVCSIYTLAAGWGWNCSLLPPAPPRKGICGSVCSIYTLAAGWRWNCSLLLPTPIGGEFVEFVLLNLFSCYWLRMKRFSAASYSHRRRICGVCLL